VVRRVPVSEDKAASEEFGRKVERLAALHAVSAPLDLPLLRWIENLPQRTLAVLRRIGLVTVQLDPMRLRPLSEPQRKGDLLADFAETLRSRGRTEKHVILTERRIRGTFEACGFVALVDLDHAKIERHLRQLRDGGKSARTSNHRLAACREFTRWAVERGLLIADPLARLRPVNARLDPRLVRRALTFEELRKLVHVAQSGPELRGVSGATRAMVWRLAAEVGLRVGEIDGLQVGDLDLDPVAPALVIRAAVAKNRTETRLPLRPELARDLAPFVREKLPTAPLMSLPETFRDKAARWLRFDLERAGIAYKDASDRVADVHSLRGSFVSMLIRSGASPKVVQTLARHSDARLTVGIYSKLRPDEERRALAGVRSIGTDAGKPEPEPQPEPMRRTGSDAADVLASRLASDSAVRCREVPPSVQGTPAGGAASAVATLATGENEWIRFPPPPPLPRPRRSRYVEASTVGGFLGSTLAPSRSLGRSIVNTQPMLA
jgi:site-specific recombinase XerC